MPITQAQAQAHYNTLPPDQQARVDAAGGPTVAWLQAAANAGVPGAVQAAGGVLLGQGGTESGWEDPAGGKNILDPGGQNAAAPSTWMGQRNPTPSELRRLAREQGWSEDFNRYSDQQLIGWINEAWDVGANKFRNPGGALVEKPTEAAGGWSPGPVSGGGGGGRFGGGGGGGGGAPRLTLPEFTPPTYEQALEDPGYQFALQEGLKGIQGSAAARGTLRTGGTLKDLLDYSQGRAAQQYGDVYNRAAQTYGLQTGADIAQFQPDWNAWQTQYGGNLARWQTQYGGNLSKYLQQEQNIYNLLSQPPPFYGGSSGGAY